MAELDVATALLKRHRESCTGDISLAVSIAQAIKEAAAGGRPLVWSKQVPTEPGYYWWRDEDDHELVCVRQVMPGLKCEHREVDSDCRTVVGMFRVSEVGGEWAGPIPEPQEATSAKP